MTNQLEESAGAPTVRRLHPVLIAAGISLAMGSPGAAWWVVGDQSSVAPSDDPNYAVRPFDLPISLERTIGFASLALVVVAAATLLVARRSGHAIGPWWSVFAPVSVAGVMVGVGWRIMTAGVYGANIGAGLLVFFGGPVVAALLVGAAVRAVVLIVRRRQRSLFTRPRR